MAARANSCVIEEGLYGKWGVKRGLRDKNGIGVLAGLTHISDVQSYEERNGISEQNFFHTEIYEKLNPLL